ncbi:hypothetical protein [Actinomadura nitritigenes]|uniref:Ferric oxidoreductase domain-containing protein n=1 Tax=Actinomadura nitritigenes TaxID=134602 RepID=A0ABS3R6X1_9ACTN|nr:hypothetical protein [Actinomadura nitritigenes]MBO2441906.1 hypothetical protein [Actinomadura nitritigenes]
MAPEGPPPGDVPRRGPAHEMTGAFLAGPGGGPRPVPAPAVAPARPGRTGGRRGRIAAGAAAAAVAGALLGLGAESGGSPSVLRPVGRFLDFYCGVFALVALSLTVMIGLLATDRAILASRHRLRAQAVHRATAFLAVAMLAVHIDSQLAEHRVGIAQALLPLPGRHAADYGIGVIAFYLLLLAVAGGIARGRFAGTRHPWVWRATHLTAYAAWPLGIWHGLTSGRAPAVWVTAGYLLCVAAVVLALAARPVLRPRERRTP